MPGRSFDWQFFENFLMGGASAAFFFAAFYLFDKTKEHDDDIEELFSRLKECEKS